ncbi:ribonuclease P protein component [Helicobacter didelphidarum]|uniref:Ribonuclease P protein component n=1 Tax=Helicobacter didelphidarum TaxID=2040648 RepID=A0A3D8IPY6_9HELI|nr:ribonuclease P protein component [Helicobacter didelphidarum]
MHSFDNLSRCNIEHLKNSYEFNLVFTHGMRFHKDFMTIHAISLYDFLTHLKNKKRYNRQICADMLLGFSINKKVAKACKRNLLRRRIKAIMRDFVKECETNNFAFVFVCRKEILELSFDNLKQHINYVVNKLINTWNKKYRIQP